MKRGKLWLLSLIISMIMMAVAGNAQGNPVFRSESPGVYLSHDVSPSVTATLSTRMDVQIQIERGVSVPIKFSITEKAIPTRYLFLSVERAADIDTWRMNINASYLKYSLSLHNSNILLLQRSHVRAREKI